MTGDDLKAAIQILGNSCIQGVSGRVARRSLMLQFLCLLVQRKIPSSALGKVSLRNVCEPLMYPCSSSKWLTFNTGVGVGVEMKR